MTHKDEAGQANESQVTSELTDLPSADEQPNELTVSKRRRSTKAESAPESAEPISAVIVEAATTNQAESKTAKLRHGKSRTAEVEATPESQASRKSSESEMMIETVNNFVGGAEDTEEIIRESEEVVEKRRFWSRFLGIFRRKSKEASVVSEDQGLSDGDLEEQTVGPLSKEELELSPSQLRKLLTSTRKEYKEITADVDLAEAELQSALSLSESLAISLQDLVDEQDKVNRSYLGQVKQTMHSEIEAAKADLAAHKENIENLKPLDSGTLLQLRQQFHRRFGAVTKHILFWAIIVTLLTNIKSIPDIGFLRDFYDNDTSGPILVAAVILIIGLASIVRRYLKLAKLSKKAFVKFVLWVTLVGAFFLFLPMVAPLIDRYISPFLRAHYWEILSALLSIWALSLFVILASYYSGWSEFRRNVQLQAHQLRGVIEGYLKTQQEVARLRILHRQVMDWMELIANAVYKPWKVNKDWGSKNEYSAHFDTFPFALRVAQAQEGNSVNMATLENDIARSLLVPGWRENAFEDLIVSIASSFGLDPQKFNSDLLDHDLPHQSNNSRALIKKYFDDSASRGDDGTDPVLTEVAKKRLLDLVSKTQSQLVSTSRPRVEQILDDPLSALREDPLGIEEYDPSETWDEFLKESLGTDTIEQVSLGALNFNLQGRMSGATSRLKTFIVTPKRFRDSLPAIADPDRVEVVSLGDDKPRSVEILARIDISDQVPFDHLTVMNSGHDFSSQDDDLIDSPGRREVL